MNIKIDKVIAEHLLKWHYESNLDFIKLLNFINDNSIPIVNSRLTSALGMATYYKIHLDIINIESKPIMLRYFIILHEIAHYKRLIKKGLDYHLHFLSSNNVNNLYNHLLNEEIIADNYASYVFNKLNDIKYPYEMTQQLKEYENKIKFINTAYSLMGKLNNTEESYKNMISTYIIND